METPTIEVDKKVLKQDKVITIPLLDVDDASLRPTRDQLKKLKNGDRVKVLQFTPNTSSSGADKRLLTRDCMVYSDFYKSSSDESCYYYVADIGRNIASNVWYRDLLPANFGETNTKFKELNPILHSIEKYKEDLLAKAESEWKANLDKLKNKALDNLKVILQDIYPERWDLITLDDKSTIYIFFPEIVITNQYKNKHTIKDLWVRIELMFDKENGKHKVQDSLSGVRSTLTESEYESNYGHSHLNTSGVRNSTWATFCLGESDFAFAYRELQINYNEDKFAHFLVFLESSYLPWESEAGGPHIRMKQIVRNGNEAPKGFSNGEVDTIYKRFMESCNLYDFLSVVGTTYKEFKVSAEHPDFITVLEKVATEDKFKCYVDSTGREVLSAANSEVVRDNIRTILNFRGKPVKFRVVPDVDLSNGPKLTINSGLKNQLVQKLEVNINNYFLNKQ